MILILNCNLDLILIELMRQIKYFINIYDGYKIKSNK